MGHYQSEDEDRLQLLLIQPVTINSSSPPRANAKLITKSTRSLPKVPSGSHVLGGKRRGLFGELVT